MFGAANIIFVGIVPVVEKVCIGIDNFTLFFIHGFPKFQKQTFKHGVRRLEGKALIVVLQRFSQLFRKRDRGKNFVKTFPLNFFKQNRTAVENRFFIRKKQINKGAAENIRIKINLTGLCLLKKLPKRIGGIF